MLARLAFGEPAELIFALTLAVPRTALTCGARLCREHYVLNLATALLGSDDGGDIAERKVHA